MINSINYLERADHEDLSALAIYIQKLNQGGHNPATSGNYSLRSHVNSTQIYVSQSGVDKSLFRPEHFIPVDKYSGAKLGSDAYSSRKLSDEAPIHLAIYRQTSAKCVLHSHILGSLLFAEMHPNNDVIEITGLEIIKGLSGIKTHEATANILCFENTQDIDSLAQQIEAVINTSHCYAIILRGHGIYVWGNSLAEAKRHLEVFEYLFQYFLAMKGIKNV